MAVAVVGCGRSGTNMVLEILRGNSKLKASEKPEDKKLFHRKQPLCESYLTKCDTVYFTENEFTNTMNLNESLKIVWTIRDPRDMILSKIKRGQPGEDNKRLADDATPEGCMNDLNKMYQLFLHAKKHFSDRLLLVKMEDVIRNIREEAQRMCDFLGIPLEEKMIDFVPRMRNGFKKKRYKTLDQGQLELWNDWRGVYDGYFAKNNYPIEDLFANSQSLVENFGYGE